MVPVVDAFEAAFSITLDPSDRMTAPVGSPCLVMEFVAEGTVLMAPRYKVEVLSAPDGTGWIGAFFGGSDGADLIICGPGPRTLVAVAGGVAYIVPVMAPEQFAVVPMRPVREALCSVESNIVILVGYTELLAVAADGALLWRSERLVSDGFLEVRLASTTVTVRGWHAPSDREIEVTLDIEGGRVISSS